MSLIPFGFWAASGAGGGVAAYDLLETTTLTSTASSVTFSGLGSYSDYAHLQIRMIVRSAWDNVSETLRPQLNADSGENYARHYLAGNGSSVNSGAQAPKEYFARPVISAAQSPTGQFTPIIFDILDFSSSSKNSTARVFSGHPSGNKNVALESGLWINTDAITSFRVQPDTNANFVAGCRFSIFGLKGN